MGSTWDTEVSTEVGPNQISDLHLRDAGDPADQRRHLRPLDIEFGLLHVRFCGQDHCLRSRASPEFPCRAGFARWPAPSPAAYRARHRALALPSCASACASCAFACSSAALNGRGSISKRTSPSFTTRSLLVVLPDDVAGRRAAGSARSRTRRGWRPIRCRSACPAGRHRQPPPPLGGAAGAAVPLAAAGKIQQQKHGEPGTQRLTWRTCRQLGALCRHDRDAPARAAMWTASAQNFVTANCADVGGFPARRTRLCQRMLP